ncbi:uncharacterized protein LOC123873994 [Maniola jurtina]|uniref:uncharacterized protein LOC123873994 n=1 Tax=Maniola jurtina TaxID=191418 RepID=UPI001E68A26A|nr:uncharacterized protein LOC123873994 [Maniola jurtina]
MALDRQRILSELGSVMNQLQSADCGCMSKLFGQSGQTSPSPGPTCGGCRRNCCHGNGHGWNSNGSCGEPYQGNAQNTYTPCMGRCNPPKLYADTYNYLNNNLIQPTIKEVYDDLKSLTPDNTIANNPMANQIVLSNGLGAEGNMSDMSKMGNMQVGNMGNMNTSNMGNISGNTGNMIAGNEYNYFNSQPANVSYVPTNEANPNQMGQMGGMGPQIMSMLGGNATSQIKTNPGIGQNVPLTQPMLTDTPQSPQGQIGITPLCAPRTTNQDVYNAQGFPSGNNVNQVMMQSNIQSGGNIKNTVNKNSDAQQMGTAHLGDHSKGIAKFNEMFPGVTKNLGGDLGFDPMAIAIQMNPANRHQAVMSSMHNMMQNNNINKVFDQSKNPALPEGTQQNQIQYNVPPNQVQQSIPLKQARNNIMQPNTNSTDLMAYQNVANYNKAVNDNANVRGYPNAQLNNQQAYMAGVPVPNQYTQPDQQQYHVEQQNIIDPNTGSEMAPPTLSSAYEVAPNQQAVHPESPNNQRVIKEPIIPVDTSRYIAPKHLKYFEFNTLGQPVEKTSAEMYRTPEPSLPQTLSPQPTPISRADTAKYAKVKSTVSKTSLMDAKTLGRTSSQLQHIYNQYKGSQSFTQQNIPAQGVNAVTHSEGRLTAPQVNHQQRQTPVERIGGDTIANNQMRDHRTVNVERVMGQIGDVPAAIKSPGDEKPNEVSPVIDRKTRNGLQDMVYTSYPSSTAWTFHGANTRPCSFARGRYRGRYR